MSKSSKLYADNSQIVTDENGPQAPLKQLSGPKADSKGRLREAILEAIGEPDDLFRVDLKQLHSPRHYRVNIYREVKGSVKMTDSHYVVATENIIVSSNPPLKKKYYDSDLNILKY